LAGALFSFQQNARNLLASDATILENVPLLE
jgi:hypothetical protein